MPLNFLVSRRSRWRPKDSCPYVRTCVCTCVCTCVTLLLENRSLLFSETLQLVRACKWEKNVPSAFLKKIPVSPILPKNCPKLVILAQNAQKWRFFAFLSPIHVLLNCQISDNSDVQILRYRVMDEMNRRVNAKRRETKPCVVSLHDLTSISIHKFNRRSAEIWFI